MNYNNSAIKPIFNMVKSKDGSIEHHTPEALHSGFIKGETSAANFTRQGFKSLSSRYADMNLKRVNGTADYANIAKSSVNECCRIITEARNSTKAEIKEFNDKLIEATGFKVDATRRNYVLGTFSGLRDNDKINAINTLIEEGHGAELAILSEVSNVFSGLPKAVRSNIASRLFAAKEPALFEKLQTAEGNLAKIEKASIANAHYGAQFLAPINAASAVSSEVHRSVDG